MLDHTITTSIASGDSHVSASSKRSADESQESASSLPLLSPSERTKRARADPPTHLELGYQVSEMPSHSLSSSEEAQQKGEYFTAPRRSVRPRNGRQNSTRCNSNQPAKYKVDEKTEETHYNQAADAHLYSGDGEMEMVSRIVLESCLLKPY